MVTLCLQHTSRPIVLALRKNAHAMASAKNASNIMLRRANYLTVQGNLFFSSHNS